MKTYLKDHNNGEEVGVGILKNKVFLTFLDNDNHYPMDFPEITEEDDYRREVVFSYPEMVRAILAIDKVETLVFELILSEDSFNSFINDEKVKIYYLNQLDIEYMVFEIEEHKIFFKQEELKVVVEAFAF